MHFCSSLPPKEAGHFPIDKAHNFVLINYTVGLTEVVMHETQIWIGICLRKKNLRFQRIDAAIAANVRVWHNVGATLGSIGRLDSLQLLQYLASLLLERFLLNLR